MSDDHTKAQRKAQSIRSARDQRLTSKLFQSDAECRLRAENHTECSNAGITNHHQIRAHGDALVALMRPVIEQTNLTGPEVAELRRETTRAGMTPQQSAARHEAFVDGLRQPIYGTKRVVEVKAQAMKAAAHQSPALRKLANQGNAANSVALGRGLFRRISEGESILRKPGTTSK